MTNRKWILVVLAVAVSMFFAGKLMLDRSKEDAHAGQAEVVRSDAPNASDMEQSRRRDKKKSAQWSLPFKVQSRLTEDEEAALLKNPEVALNQAALAQADILNLLVAWAGSDPDAAMRWLDSRGENLPCHMRSALGAIAAGHLIHGGPDAMHQFIEKYNQDPRLVSKAQGRLDSYAYYLLGRSDTLDLALKMLKDKPDENLAGALIVGVNGSNQKMAFIDYLEAKKLHPALEYWSLQGAADEAPRAWVAWALRRNSDMLPELIQNWAREDKEAAKAWINSEMMKDDSRLEEIRLLID